ncbi:Probable sodium-coupled neutral amino acid transporter 6 (N-system amino acid transporter 1) (NAT-1) (Na(+)-coupled neutral amino acid transporter 6) (Solute carrier family 38 member 6) [Durusdinium trenchii]|uniref:Probable sodium-coupled neutral amino acid transporter 6 (N-system amino acid transporter 1) (NAT-1) (Na(+)-coupled neutral amino acid transporter 6) (Solute carrier family 38 member 6) n=1 Tax=Durusdinium trenchii TaxID=1381693 RepID=A0ABP0P517_9DINO
MIGCFGQVWVVLSMQIRYLDGSYRPGGQFYDSLPKEEGPKRFSTSQTLLHELLGAEDQPDFTLGVIYWKTTVASFVLLGSLSTAFIAHYNAPKFYSQLQDATPEKFQKVVFGAFTFAMVIYLWVMAVGYLTFGSNADGLILNNYSEKAQLPDVAEHDVLITTARFAISFVPRLELGEAKAVVFAFPLGFTGLRDSMMSTFEIPEDRFLPVTFGLLSVIVLGACCFHDLGLANSLGGAVLGAMITLIFPGILHLGAGQFCR